MIRYRHPFSLLGIPLILALAGCGSGPDGTRQASEPPTAAPAKMPAPAPAGRGGGGEADTQATNQADALPTPARPQLAYSYRYGFRLPADAVAATQKAHADACEKLGMARCRVINMTRSGDENHQFGALQISIDAGLARSFGADLGAIASGKGGRQTDAGISAEDLSKQIVDTDARVRAKTLLADRLTQLLATRSGSVADLVEAERALSQVQEELDQARTWLAEMKGRVAMSDMAISYSSTPTAGSSLLSPVRDAISSAGEILGFSIGALIRFLVAALPWLLVLWGAVKLYRKLGGRFPRLRWWRKSADPQGPEREGGLP
ncbi:MAG: DUF4349 domain-containing protein [Sphingobium sp.]